MASPVLAYPGAKWRFYKHIKPYIPSDTRLWVEPFFGGGSMSLSIADDPDFNLERMVVGDLAPEIWAFWTGCRDHAPEVAETVENWFKNSCPTHPYLIGLDTKKFKGVEDEKDLPSELKEGYRIYKQAMAEAVGLWSWAQTVDCSELTLVQRAARVFIVNKISFSGMGDSGSLSRDRFEAFRLDQTRAMIAAQALLQRMEIYNISFEKTMQYANESPEKAFVFLDPPYANQEKSGLYGRGGDTHKGFPHQLFAQTTRELKCKWFVTYDDSVIVRRMFAGKDVYGNDIRIKPFKIPGGYTMAIKVAEDALEGEEVFIANYDIGVDEQKENAYDLL